MEPTVRRMRRHERGAALACYTRNDYGGGIAEGDRPFVAVAPDGGIVGVVRLAHERGHTVLRGMFLDEAHRGRGLGTRMLQALVVPIGREPCWLVCGPHLRAFYGRIGFEPVPEAEAPPHLAERARTYVSRHGPIGVMRRPGAP